MKENVLKFADKNFFKKPKKPENRYDGPVIACEEEPVLLGASPSGRW